MTAGDFMEMWQRFLATEVWRARLTSTKPMDVDELLYFGDRSPEQKAQDLTSYLDSIVGSGS